jgi:hypothetical protein
MHPELAVMWDGSTIKDTRCDGARIKINPDRENSKVPFVAGRGRRRGGAAPVGGYSEEARPVVLA